MSHAPLEKPELLLPSHIRSVVDRDTPIPTIALRAAAIKKNNSAMVRADIGQISEVDPSLEVYYGPPVGLDELRALLAETWNRTFHWDTKGLGDLPNGLTPKHVVVCTGAAEALSVLFHCFAHNKNVGLPKGHWENYTNGVEMAGGRVVLLDFFDKDGKLDIEGITSTIKEKNISLLVANFPCNPTGAVLSDEENRAFGKMLQDTNCVAIADEVYCRLRYDGQAPTTLLEAAPGHVVAISSASKEYLLPGVRVGYIFATNADFTDRMLRRLIRANTASPNVLGQKRALALMEQDLADLRQNKAPQVLSKVRDEMKHRRDQLLQILEKHQMSAVGRANHKPEGTIFLMAGLPSWWKGTDVELTEKLLEEQCVSVVPGSAFGMERCVRFSFGGLSTSQLAQLDQNLEKFQAKFGGA